MSEEWSLNKSAGIPLHQQIYDRIKEKIMNGEWPVGTRIPPQRELAERFGVNRSTVVYALGELAADGLIEAMTGRGTVVANNTWNLLSSAPSPDWNRYVSSGFYQPNIRMIQAINKAEADPGIVRLGTGELSSELLPAGEMLDKLNRSHAAAFSLGYSEPKGSLALREAVSRYLRSKAIIASPASILIVSGGLQALQLISLGLLHRGSTIFVENPSYLNSIHVFQSAGVHMHGLPMDEEGLRTESISRLKRQHNASLLYTIPSFHNPTGSHMSSARRQELLNLCSRERLPVIEDDVYGDLWLEQPAPLPLKARDQQGLVLYLGSMSKTLGPGLRIGWIVGPEPVIDRLADIKMQTDYGSSALSQHAVAQWLSEGLYEEHLTRIRRVLKLRRDYTLRLLEEDYRELADWSCPQGGFYIWLRFKRALSIRSLFDHALAEGILLNPGMIYDRNDRQHLRLSYAYASMEELRDGLQRLSRMIRGLA
ncbi:PLP-dependent aminotransferase family protein [Paenibacillus sp. FSL K6-1566]|uniref:MocR-like pyridoxine biosynthesis transcription factor PdxR n=1 Tax=Paenibacillus TaxID=44249 RepID=UPI000EDB1CE3|nr:PLP-dependent aminotransferase family protein [Paenibacillus lactis]HAF97741.1 GntR family transcriptional regulator [Paenibacillus lactis]